ncbi:cobalt/zinc/cadmium resistance heavy metal efflux pump protein CzcC [Neokomagataea thailandica NBRC 106555]|uniref:TolC family protein n=2 Tax=Neokomagataea TaxID=1223423 RepID=A0A4Y6V9L7_9PROT|nr:MULTISPECIES: TolC family protein [Neokomagataea]QDH26044.1 TolC family protein [Neokomagataea tanensis]GBR52346.1 cobalt/zinc/cadmium resistance heavy metal efflux pump protein CzcC [Neokomagataea thailandica NBRC 106555]
MQLYPPCARRLRGQYRTAIIAVGCVIALNAHANAKTWSFHDAVRAAWTRDPAQAALHVAAQAADTEASAARTWFPAGAIINAQYLDDHFIGSNQGYTTYQGQISMPFWLPGQGTATERAALADKAVARANADMERMAIAIQVLDIASAARTEERRLAVLSTEYRVAGDIAERSDHAFAVGEEARTDRDAVFAFLSDIGAQQAQSTERLAGYRADLSRLTGSDALPDIMTIDGRFLDRQGNIQERLVVERDPRVIYADKVVRAADASLDVTRRTWMPAPSAGIQVVRQKQFEALWDTAVGVQVAMQLPSRSQHEPQLMRKVRAEADAQRDLLRARQIVGSEYSHTFARLRASVDILNEVRSQCAALSDRQAQMTRAWRIGETSVIEALRAHQAALSACQSHEAAEVAWHAAIARLLISIGATP